MINHFFSMLMKLAGLTTFRTRIRDISHLHNKHPRAQYGPEHNVRIKRGTFIKNNLRLVKNPVGYESI